MLGVTIGIGEGWATAAKRTARRMEEMTGLECAVITEDPSGGAAHPSWVKCWVPRLFPAHASYLVFDADILPLRTWDPVRLFEGLGRNFCGVPEANIAPVLQECRAYRLPFPDWYVNGGLLMFSYEHKEIWEAVWQYHPAYGSWLEQTALNKVLYERHVEVARLPRIYNTLLKGSKEVAGRTEINLHADSLGGDAGALMELQDLAFGLTAEDAEYAEGNT